MSAHISMITLGVSVLSRSLLFYREGLGLTSTQEKEGAVFFPLEGAWLVLWPLEKLADAAQIQVAEEGAGRVALAYNVTEKADVEKVLLAAQKQGGQITRPASETSWGGYAGYIVDPDGHLWEIVWNPKWRR